MDNTEHPGSRETAAHVIVALEMRVHTLEQKVAGMLPAAAPADVRDASVPGPGDAAMGGRIASHAAQLAALSSGLSSQRGKLRDVERALVERIADVDDDRRRTASALQRALHTQREEQDALASRRGWLMAGGVVLCIVLSVIALFLGNRQTREEGAPAPGELAQIRQELAQAFAVGTEDDLLRSKLTGLTEAVADISSSLEELSASQERDVRADFDAERASRHAVETRLAEQLQRLEETQRRMAREIAALRAALGGRGPASVAEVGLGAPITASASAGESVPVEPLVAADGSEIGPSELPEQEMPADRSDASGPTFPIAPGNGSDVDSQRDPDPSASGGAESAVDVGKMVTVGDPSFAIQLIGFYSLDALRELANRADMPARLFYRRETLRGKPWYVLIHSLHEDLASAAAERSRLPPDLAALDIWIRPLRQGTELEVLESSRDE